MISFDTNLLLYALNRATAPGSVGREAKKTWEASYSGTGSTGWQEMNIVDSE